MGGAERSLANGARLLCVGDLHLGRTPGRLPRGLETSVDELGPAAALRGVTEWACAERRAGRPLDAVLFAGDLVERERDFLEGHGQLSTAAERLRAAGVDVRAVAGNHDTEVAPRLADAGVGFALLGRQGRWEAHLVRRDGAVVARVLGWSFPARHVRASPLEGFPSEWGRGEFADGVDVPTVGLLHADLDQTTSPYAPVARAELATRGGVGAWALGHVHAPDRAGLAAPRPLGYLGSLVGLDAGEPGAHGPWLLEWDGACWLAGQVPLAPLRYEELPVDATGAADVEELEERSVRALDALDARLRPEAGALRAVGLRLTLVGRSPLGRGERVALLARLRAAVHRRGDVEYFVETVLDEVRSEVDLARLAESDDAIGLLARRLTELEAGGEACAELVRGAMPRLHEAARERHFAALEEPSLGPDEVRTLLHDAARRALDDLLAQTPGRAEQTTETVLTPARARDARARTRARPPA